MLDVFFFLMLAVSPFHFFPFHNVYDGIVCLFVYLFAYLPICLSFSKKVISSVSFLLLLVAIYFLFLLLMKRVRVYPCVHVCVHVP